MAICWERAVPLAFHLCCFYFSAVLVVRVPFPLGVWGRVWNSIVSVRNHCFLSNFLDLTASEDIEKAAFENKTKTTNKAKMNPVRIQNHNKTMTRWRGR